MAAFRVRVKVGVRIRVCGVMLRKLGLWGYCRARVRVGVLRGLAIGLGLELDELLLLELLLLSELALLLLLPPPLLELE